MIIFHLSDWPFPFHPHLGQFHFLAHHQRHTVCLLVPGGQYHHLSIHIQSPLSQLSIHSLPSLGDLAACHQHDTKCTIEFMHLQRIPTLGGNRLISQLLCKSKTFPWPWFFLQNVSYLNLLKSVYFGCPIQQIQTFLSLSVTGCCTRALDQAWWA